MMYQPCILRAALERAAFPGLKLEATPGLIL